MNSLELYCNRCCKPLVTIESVSAMALHNPCEALCSECSMIRRGAEELLKDIVESNRQLKRENAELKRGFLCDAFIQP